MSAPVWHTGSRPGTVAAAEAIGEAFLPAVEGGRSGLGRSAVGSHLEEPHGGMIAASLRQEQREDESFHAGGLLAQWRAIAVGWNPLSLGACAPVCCGT
jgi:hypothetical protein